MIRVFDDEREAAKKCCPLCKEFIEAWETMSDWEFQNVYGYQRRNANLWAILEDCENRTEPVIKADITVTLVGDSDECTAQTKE